MRSLRASMSLGSLASVELPLDVPEESLYAESCCLPWFSCQCRVGFSFFLVLSGWICRSGNCSRNRAAYVPFRPRSARESRMFLCSLRLKSLFFFSCKARASSVTFLVLLLIPVAKPSLLHVVVMRSRSWRLVSSCISCRESCWIGLRDLVRF